MHRHRGGDILIFAESLNDSQSIAELVLAVNPALGGRVRPRPRPTSLTRQAGTRAVARWVEDIRQAVVAHEAAGRHVAAVLVHRDADSADPDGEIAAKLKNQLASVGGHPVVPVQAIEAWWFLFPDAVEAVRPRAWRDLMPRRSRDVEGIVRPKDELARLTGQRARTPYSEADSPAIARNVNVHSGRRFDVVLANPPFNMSGWAGSGDSAQDVRWRYGVPPDHNANFAWLQHAVAMLAEQGRAAVLMANGAASTQDPQERAIRTAMINDGAVESIVALPPQLFHSTAIPVTLWLLRAPVGGSSASPVLFVDARATGRLVSRTRRVLTNDDIVLAGPSGGVLQGETHTASGVPVVGPRDLKGNRIVLDGSLSVDPDAAEKLRRYRLAAGDIVCARTGEIGRHALVHGAQAGYLFGTACLRLRPREPVSHGYLAYYLDHPGVRDWIDRNATGSAIPSLSAATLGAFHSSFRRPGSRPPSARSLAHWTNRLRSTSRSAEPPQGCGTRCCRCSSPAPACRRIMTNRSDLLRGSQSVLLRPNHTQRPGHHPREGLHTVGIGAPNPTQYEPSIHS